MDDFRLKIGHVYLPTRRYSCGAERDDNYELAITPENLITVLKITHEKYDSYEALDGIKIIQYKLLWNDMIVYTWVRSVDHNHFQLVC